MTAYWCGRALLPAAVAQQVRIAVEDGRITSVDQDVPPRPGDVRLPGTVLPGLANGHSHAFHRALRGRTHGDGGTFWTWRDHMYAVARRLEPELYLALARGVFAEMVGAGYTVVGEFHYLHHGPGGAPYADPNAMGAALCQAAAEAGIRLTLLDTLYLAGGLDADGHQPLREVQRRFGDGDVDGWAARRSAAGVWLGEGTPVRLGAAIHSVRAVPRAALAEVAAVAADDEGMPLHAHVSEQVGENDAARGYYGSTPTELLDEAGLLTERFTAVHATHLDDRDIELLGASGATACICPSTERDLADGIGPARELHDRGVPLSLGSDQHAVVDPFEEVRGLEMDERLASRERGRFVPAELLAAASEHGYRSLGWPEGGAIETDALADLVAVDDASPRTAGSAPDQLVLAATAADVTDVVVAGQPVVTGGEHRLGPVGPLLRDAIAAIDALQEGR